MIAFATTAIAVTVAISVAALIKPGIGLNMNLIEAENVTVAEKTSAVDTLLDIIPDNPFSSLANGNMLQVREHPKVCVNLQTDVR